MGPCMHVRSAHAVCQSVCAVIDALTPGLCVPCSTHYDRQGAVASTRAAALVVDGEITISARAKTRTACVHKGASRIAHKRWGKVRTRPPTARTIPTNTPPPRSARCRQPNPAAWRLHARYRTCSGRRARTVYTSTARTEARASERASDSPTELILVEAAGLGHVPFFERLPYPVLPLQLLEKGLMLLDRLLHVHGGRGCARVGVRAVRVSAGAMRAHCAVCVRARSGA